MSGDNTGQVSWLEMISSARLLGVLVIINNGTGEEHVPLLVLGGWQNGRGTISLSGGGIS